MTLPMNPLRLTIVSYVIGVPAVALAQGSASDAHSPAQAVGRVLGMMVFGYLVMRWVKRRKEARDSAPKTGLRAPVKPVYVVMVLVLGLALLMWLSG